MIKTLLKCFIVALSAASLPLVLHAQSLPADSVSLKADSNSKKLSVPPVANKVVTGLQNSLSAPAKQAAALKPAASTEAGKVKDAFSKSLDKTKPGKLSIDIGVEEGVRYQPASGTSPAFPGWANVVGVRGVVQAFGIPLNVNFSNDRTTFSGLNGLTNNLFKFDFDPRQFTGMFKSDLQQYYDLRRTAFGGLDMAGYTRKVLMDQLKSEQGKLAGSIHDAALTKYLNNPAEINNLLNLNEDQIRQKLTAVAREEAKKGPVKQLNNIDQANSASALTGLANQTAQGELKSGLSKEGLNNIDPLHPVAGLEANAKGKLAGEQASALKKILAEPALQPYLTDPAKLKELQKLDKQQLMQKLRAITQKDVKTPQNAKAPAVVDVADPVPDLDMAAVVNNTLKENDAHHDIALQNLANNILTSKQGSLLTNQASLTKNAQANTQLPAQTSKDIDSAARTITRIKAQLQNSGVDVNKMMQIQKMLDGSNGALPATEYASSIVSRKPGSGIQSLFSNVQSLKIGSFGGQVPGNTQGQDMFLSGTHITYKFGTIPVTAGYGSSNDMNSAKDAAYQSSVYNSPKDVTYLGAQIKRGVFGNVKLAITSSFGTSNTNAPYGTSASASNNVAFTVSKDMNMGAIGHVTVDVSKSTTLYNNNYQIGSDIILAQKAGVNLNTTNDLFEAVGFNVNQHLDIKKLDMSDNIYFDYAGMGYQNPGNNGYGGARKKLGGNLKKAFNKNKLVLNLRTDLSAMPISYTTSDQWRSYQLQLDSRYIVSKKLNLSLKYTANGTSKQIDEVITPVYSYQKLQADGNINYKVGKNFTVSHFSLGYQTYSNVVAAITSTTGGTGALPAADPSLTSNLITATYTQSTVINRNTLTGTMMFNKELTPNSLIGNMLNADVSYQYMLFNKLSLSSGLTYLNNTGIASQAGIRQMMQLFATRNFDMNTFVDLRKNLVTPQYGDLYPAARVELSLKYHFKN
ncbi:hypothetical protein BEL04_03445 [Mucilaginibacter sp. PPCGB 2223]|uniref:hypothetical protein n=1 Tax=Mucilaginibacter sp. PPCGB 2223 TaxID=1886027 RepID=UPI000825D114|nr:hypothetical protein [Mucilaginibacter sp. PPCGB 2223]OCX53368.1 hypothetical protein BEL04_03445 [Mucilaginibacter sp. PPCGB 2223]